MKIERKKSCSFLTVLTPLYVHFFMFSFLARRRVLTNAKEEQGLHAEKLFLGDLQHLKLLREMPHPYAVLVHGGNVHSVSANVREKKGQDEGM